MKNFIPTTVRDITHNEDTQTQGNNEPLAGPSRILDDVQPNQASTNHGK
ncbi:hypothetical protein LSH36_997g02041 [Paralvinella palmiformis]|uniref:Uncharacterized protein n=1 Tax=Paralvinella palmiformis TaxID=53620 RepID=A0AAD9IXE0_9ANNE|nr:hypothetical protein LSH36_997g02041 [Paralvinella palmiformis]